MFGCVPTKWGPCHTEKRERWRLLTGKLSPLWFFVASFWKMYIVWPDLYPLYCNVKEKEKLLTAGQSQRMRKGRSGLRSKFWDLFWGMADLRLENVDKKNLKKRDFLDCTRDWLCYWRPRRRWQSWFDKKSCRAFCTICYKRFPHSLKILSLGPLAFTKGTEVFTFFVSKDLLLIKVFCLPCAWRVTSALKNCVDIHSILTDYLFLFEYLGTQTQKKMNIVVSSKIIFGLLPASSPIIHKSINSIGEEYVFCFYLFFQQVCVKHSLSQTNWWWWWWWS